MSRLLVFLLLAGCPGDSPTDLTWWEDPCGRRDPVERECQGVATIEVGDELTCADDGMVAQEVCSQEGATCVLRRALACEDDPDAIIASSELLTCGTEPPDDLCPESRRILKEDIRYLDQAGRAELSKQMLALQPASYRYRDPAHGEGPKLGYLLDDAPDLPSSGDERVDLYAYSTAILVTVQEQQHELEALRAELRALREGACPP